MFKRILLGIMSLGLLTPSPALACACGCGVFEVSTGGMLPTSAGGMAWLEYDFLDQTDNWSGTSRAPAANNPDRRLRTDFFTAGAQYMFDRSWGAQVEVPYANRDFKTTGDSGDFVKAHDHEFGDVRLKGIYTGFSEDMSTGLTFGLKLPTGPFTTPGFDRDTQIGSGSVNFLLGAFHVGDLTGDGLFDWFVNGQWDRAFLIQNHYRPGDEFNAATGVYYNGFDFAKAGKLAPVLQLIGSYRLRDAGINADPDRTGYSRLFISPGLEYDVNDIKLYGDLEFPVYQNMNGNQLTAPVLVKFIVGYSF